MTKTATAPKKTRVAPTMNVTTLALAEGIKAAEIGLEQLRLLEQAVAALKKAAQPKAGESKSAIAKAKSLAKHSVAMNGAKAAIKAKHGAKALEYISTLPVLAIRELAKDANIKGRNKMDKLELIAALLGADLLAEANEAQQAREETTAGVREDIKEEAKAKAKVKKAA
jgi:hypothetical protein